MDEFQQNRWTRKVATADFLTSGPTDGDKFLFCLKTIEMLMGYYFRP